MSLKQCHTCVLPFAKQAFIQLFIWPSPPPLGQDDDCPHFIDKKTDAGPRPSIPCLLKPRAFSIYQGGWSHHCVPLARATICRPTCTNLKKTHSVCANICAMAAHVPGRGSLKLKRNLKITSHRGHKLDAGKHAGPRHFGPTVFCLFVNSINQLPTLKHQRSPHLKH